jgi:hypothetical protein
LISGRTALQKWDVATGEEIPILRPPGNPLRALALSPDGKTIAFAGDCDRLRLADVATGKTRLHATVPCRGGASFSPDGNHLAVAPGDQAVVLWDVAKLRGSEKPFAGEPAAVLRCAGKVTAFAFSPDRKHLATAEEGGFARVYDIASKREVAAVKPPGRRVFAVAFSPDGKLLATMGEQGMTPQVARLWDSFTGKEMPAGEEARRAAHTVAFHPNGKILAAIHLPDAARTPLTGYKVLDLSLPPAEDRIETVRLWDIASARERLRFVDPVRRKNAALATAWLIGRSSSEPVAFSPAGRVFAAPGAGGIVLYETASGNPRLRLPGHLQTVTGLAFTPDGKTLVSASADSTVLIWDVTGLRTGARVSDKAERLWAVLADADPERAGVAVWSMVGQPAESLIVLRQRLKPIPAGQDVVAKLIAKLDDPSYTVREKATRQLATLGPAAEEGLVNRLRAGASLETSRRIDKLLRTVTTQPPPLEHLQLVRAVEVLERMGTTGARGYLRELANGAEGAWLTRQARDALGRMKRR